MKETDLNYKNVKSLIETFESKGRGESASFLNWFLENIYRLDDVTADDCICDQSNDKGIDGIYVDNNAQEIHFFQSKLVQSDTKTIGDVELKNLLGSLKQFETKASIDKIIDSGAHPDLKKVLTRSNVANLVENGYQCIGIFICNQARDKNTEELLQHTTNLIIYDRKAICDAFVDFDADEGIEGEFVFDASYVAPLVYNVDKDIDIYMLPVSATELVKLSGIGDASLFSQNVRLSLGNTPVNKAISLSVNASQEHRYFPLYHNGVTLLCESAELDNGQLRVKNYVVVNGAQSISTFHRLESKLSGELRVFAKIISLRDEQLAKKITINSNNQNSIKPRDLRSTHDLMLRLKAEFDKSVLPYEFEIKRGEEFNSQKRIISNEEAGRLLLAFDVREPYSCHQIYKVFDDQYAEIFGRPEVDAFRIALLHEIMDAIEENLGELANKQMAGYRLTRYLMLDIIAHILRAAEPTAEILSRKELVRKEANRKSILEKMPDLLSNLIVDLNYEVAEEGEAFDYKKDFKSPERVKTWRERLLRSYEKDLKRGKTVDFSSILVA